MKNLIFILFFLILANCSKSKTVLICGNHVCVNKAEAEQYFEENLTIEVKVVNKREEKNFDLVELNLKEDSNGKKKININTKIDTRKDLRILSDDEITTIKKKVKIKNKQKKIVKKTKTINDNKNEKRIVKIKETRKTEDNSIKSIPSIKLSKKYNKVFDVCTILKKCSIDEISKYLLKEGNSKDFPDITKK
jgi:hypothetical protein